MFVMKRRNQVICQAAREGGRIGDAVIGAAGQCRCNLHLGIPPTARIDISRRQQLAGTCDDNLSFCLLERLLQRLRGRGRRRQEQGNQAVCQVLHDASDNMVLQGVLVGLVLEGNSTSMGV